MATSGSQLRTHYAAVAEIPPELRELHEAMLDGNARTILGLLLESPGELAFGVYHPESRTVTPYSVLEWQSRIGRDAPWSSSLRNRVPAREVQLAVISLRVILQRCRRLSFNVWQEWVGGAAAPGMAEERLVVRLGLVDMRRPLQAAVLAG